MFLYAAAAAFLDPTSWIGFLPLGLQKIFPANILLSVFSVYEILLALWLISGWRTFYAAILASLTLFLIIITNIGVLDIVFRDAAILFSAVGLAVLSYRSLTVN